MKAFRLLRADEIECRVSRVTQKGVVLLLYKTARTDADLLDEKYGPENWQNDFKVVDGTLYGGIGIWCPDPEFAAWVWKWDAGTDSNTEAEKGRASDAFKRAGFKWGIGRELYSAPFMFIPAARCNIDNGKCYDKFEVADIAYDEQERVCYLRITVKGADVFEWGEPPAHGGLPLAGAEILYCADCGRPIRDGKKKDGSVWKAADIAKYTHAFAGRDLCADCGKVEKAKQDERPIR